VRYQHQCSQTEIAIFDQPLRIPLIETFPRALYNFQQNSLPHAASNPPPAPKPRRWTILAAGFLLLALVLVVVYTGRAAFLSPLALVVVAAIGLVALLLQLRLRQELRPTVHAPLWLNVVGLIFAVAAAFSDRLHFGPNAMVVAALGAILCFAISGIVVLRALRKPRS
jgi:drug/metabolite transporter (DMT)-like permease